MRRFFRLRTIRSLLWAGFGSTIFFLAASGAGAIYSLQSLEGQSRAEVRDLYDELSAMQRVANAIMQEIAIGMQYVNTGSETEGDRYRAAADEADKLRRDALGLAVLAPDERKELEEIGRLPTAKRVAVRTRRASCARRLRTSRRSENRSMRSGAWQPPVPPHATVRCAAMSRAISARSWSSSWQRSASRSISASGRCAQSRGR